MSFAVLQQLSRHLDKAQWGSIQELSLMWKIHRRRLSLYTLLQQLHSLRHQMTLSGGSSSRTWIEIPSFAMIANFNMICQRSHLKGGSSVGFSQKVRFQGVHVIWLMTAPCDIPDRRDTYLSHEST